MASAFHLACQRRTLDAHPIVAFDPFMKLLQVLGVGTGLRFQRGSKNPLLGRGAAASLGRLIRHIRGFDTKEETGRGYMGPAPIHSVGVSIGPALTQM